MRLSKILTSFLLEIFFSILIFGIMLPAVYAYPANNNVWVFDDTNASCNRAVPPDVPVIGARVLWGNGSYSNAANTNSSGVVSFQADNWGQIVITPPPNYSLKTTCSGNPNPLNPIDLGGCAASPYSCTNNRYFLLTYPTPAAPRNLSYTCGIDQATFSWNPVPTLAPSSAPVQYHIFRLNHPPSLFEAPNGGDVQRNIPQNVNQLTIPIQPAVRYPWFSVQSTNSLYTSAWGSATSASFSCTGPQANITGPLIVSRGTTIDYTVNATSFDNNLVNARLMWSPYGAATPSWTQVTCTTNCHTPNDNLLNCSGGTCTGTFTWDLTSVPEGYYWLVVAADAARLKCTGNYKPCTGSPSGLCDLYGNSLVTTDTIKCAPDQSDARIVRVQSVGGLPTAPPVPPSPTPCNCPSSGHQDPSGNNQCWYSAANNAQSCTQVCNSYISSLGTPLVCSSVNASDAPDCSNTSALIGTGCNACTNTGNQNAPYYQFQAGLYRCQYNIGAPNCDANTSSVPGTNLRACACTNPCPTAIPTAAPLPTAVPTTIPGCSTLGDPSRLRFTCNAAGTNVTVSWDAGLNATNYMLRFDMNPDSWYDSCSNFYPGDSCASTGSTSYTLPIVPDQPYRWWVHSVDACGNWSNPPQVARFACLSTAPTPVASEWLQIVGGNTFQGSISSQVPAGSYYSAENPLPAPTGAAGVVQWNESGTNSVPTSQLSARGWHASLPGGSMTQWLGNMYSYNSYWQNLLTKAKTIHNNVAGMSVDFTGATTPVYRYTGFSDYVFDPTVVQTFLADPNPNTAVVMVSGNLELTQEFTVGNTGTNRDLVVFLVSGNLMIDSTVKNDLDAIFIVQGKTIIKGDPAVSALRINGAIYSTGITVEPRSHAATEPTVKITFRPANLLKILPYLGKTSTDWQELSP